MVFLPNLGIALNSSLVFIAQVAAKDGITAPDSLFFFLQVTWKGKKQSLKMEMSKTFNDYLNTNHKK